MLASVLFVDLEFVLEANSHAFRNGLALILIKQLGFLLDLLLVVLFAEVKVQVEFEQAVSTDGNMAAFADELDLRFASHA